MSKPLIPFSEQSQSIAGEPIEFSQDSLRLEAVTVCVGFDDMLDVAIGVNHPHLDTLIVVTSHFDRLTQAVCHKHGVQCVQTDLFHKNGRAFNKGAAINAGMSYFQYHGWRMHLDADILLPDNFRRMLFNHTHLHRSSLYGCDRVDIVGVDELREHLNNRHLRPQHVHRALVQTPQRQIGGRFVSPLHGYLPLGFFQLWHASCQKDYPYSLGTAAHDDTMFSALWPADHRHHLPTVVVSHLCARDPVWGENWDGFRQQPRLGSV
jgi:hypothetical protein